MSSNKSKTDRPVSDSEATSFQEEVAEAKQQSERLEAPFEVTSLYEQEIQQIHASNNEQSTVEVVTDSPESITIQGQSTEIETTLSESESGTVPNQTLGNEVGVFEPESRTEPDQTLEHEVPVIENDSSTEPDRRSESEMTISGQESGAEAEHTSDNEETCSNADDSVESDPIQLETASTQTDIINRTPNYLSDEETNFLRFCHLVQKVAPQAVRHRFDQEFPPTDLDTKIRSNLTTLTELKRKRILTAAQWRVLLPQGSPALSTDFDVTLMICLFRHLSSVTPQSADYNTLPPPSDESLGADLATVKYYRNMISHCLEKDRSLDNSEFAIVWESLSKAIGRLGGQKYEQECANLLVANLDHSYMDIYREFLVTEASLKEKMKDIEEKLKDSIPRNERDRIDSLIQQWREVDKKFVETNGYTSLRNALQTESVAIVTGSPGSGKSCTAQHALLSLSSAEYDIIPVTSSTDMYRFFSRHHRQAFYIDNLCGMYNISTYDIEEWERNRERISDILTSPLTKCIFTCRLQIYQDPKFVNLNLEEVKIFNLSGSHQLSLEEKKSVGKMYLQDTTLKRLSDKTITQSECFPLLCSLYSKHSHESVLYFEKPNIYFTAELDELKKKPDKLKYACIVLCVMFNDNITHDLFAKSDDVTANNILKCVLEECEVNTSTPKKTILSQFDSMVASYFQKNDTGYKSIHDYMFDIYCSHVSTSMLQFIIEHADSRLLRDRALLQSLGEDSRAFTIVIPVTMESMFWKRIIKDINNCNIWDVYSYRQMKYVAYREKLISLLQKNHKIINNTDEDGTSALYVSSYNGHSDIVDMLCSRGGNVNKSTTNGHTPLFTASFKGHKTCVEVLFNRGAEVNTSDNNGFSPLHVAAQEGHSDIVDLLCNRGGNVNQSTTDGQTPLFIAAYKGHSDIVDLLCNRESNVNQSNMDGRTPLFAASFEGHKTCVEVLLNRGAEVNTSNNNGFSPLHVAAQEGHSDIVDLFCNREGSVNQSTKDGRTPLFIASQKGHCDIVDMLCNSKSNVNQSTKDGCTPLFIASYIGHCDIVDMLCTRGGNVNQCTNRGHTPLYIALKKGHSTTVDMLRHRKAVS